MKEITIPATPGTVRLMFTWNPDDPVNGKPECIWRAPVVAWVTTQNEEQSPEDDPDWSVFPLSPLGITAGWEGGGNYLRMEAIKIDGVIYGADGDEFFTTEAEWIAHCVKYASEEWAGIKELRQRLKEQSK